MAAALWSINRNGNFLLNSAWIPVKMVLLSIKQMAKGTVNNEALRAQSLLPAFSCWAPFCSYCSGAPAGMNSKMVERGTSPLHWWPGKDWLWTDIRYLWEGWNCELIGDSLLEAGQTLYWYTSHWALLSFLHKLTWPIPHFSWIALIICSTAVNNLVHQCSTIRKRRFVASSQPVVRNIISSWSSIHPLRLVAANGPKRSVCNAVT